MSSSDSARPSTPPAVAREMDVIASTPESALDSVEVATDEQTMYLRRRKKYEQIAVRADDYLRRFDGVGDRSSDAGSDHDGPLHPHEHFSARAPGLRAAVLGANDGLVSVASLIFGVIGGNLTHDALVVAAIAGLIGGAISMAIGELISVYSSRDSEYADIMQEKRAHEMGEEAEAFEFAELTKIYENKGLSRDLAKQVAIELSANDVLKAHLTDELQLDSEELSDPLQAAIYSFLSFLAGAIGPVLVCIFVTDSTSLLIAMSLVTAFVLVMTGVISGVLSGGFIKRSILRICVGGAGGIAVTFLVTWGISIAYRKY